MDIVRFGGGLGNQMFQYALIEALEAKGRKVKASLGYYDKHPEAMRFCLCNVFPNIKLDYISNLEFDKIDAEWIKIKQNPEKKQEFFENIKERFFWVENPDFSTYRPEIFETKACVFVGCWQTEKYFLDIREKLLNKFEFKKVKELEEYVQRIIRNKNCISVHIRRGDYLEQADKYGNICTKHYYESAIAYMKKNVPNSKFVFFSDDIIWVKKNFAISDAEYCTGKIFRTYEDWYDMYLMSQCSHNIVANSSFSWWGAWLNKNENKIVISPKKWMNIRPMPDIHPDSWIQLDG